MRRTEVAGSRDLARLRKIPAETGSAQDWIDKHPVRAPLLALCVLAISGLLACWLVSIVFGWDWAYGGRTVSTIGGRRDSVASLPGQTAGFEDGFIRPRMNKAKAAQSCWRPRESGARAPGIRAEPMLIEWERRRSSNVGVPVQLNERDLRLRTNASLASTRG